MNRIYLMFSIVQTILIMNSCSKDYSTKSFNQTTNFYNLKGSVKKLNSKVFEAKIVGNEIVNGERIDSRLLSQNRELIFNRHGQLKSERQYSKNDKLKFEMIFEYYPNGRINKYFTSDSETQFFYNELDSIERITTSHKKMKRVIKAEYDENMRIIKEYEKINDSLISFSTNKYNDGGKLIEKSKYDSNNKLENRVLFNYIQDELISKTLINTDSLKTGIGKIVIEYKYQDNEISEQKTIYNDSTFIILTYDYYENGIIKKENEFQMNFEGKSSYIRENEYDSLGNIVISDIFDTIEYEYDSQNNWIKKTVFQSDYPSFIVYREIDYYE